jgi:hypothetical protein
MWALRETFRHTAIVLTLMYAVPTATSYRDWSNVIRTNKNATVLIRIESGGNSSYGSGVLVTPDGGVLTAKHILPPAEKVSSSLLTALVGWEWASIDFSNARRLKIVYISRNQDLAILQFDPPPLGATFASADTNTEAGMPLLVMAYPSGGALQSTPGIVSGHGPGGTFTTSAVVGKGESGGPVFGVGGAMIGILLEGSVRGATGAVELGYFLGATTIEQDLNDHRPDIHLAVGLPPASTLPPLERISVSYSLDDDKTDHSGISPSADTRERVFYAQDGYRIVSASFRETSRNHAGIPELIVSPDGTRLAVKYSIESGPLFDQWRGWIVGSIITEQQRK